MGGWSICRGDPNTMTLPCVAQDGMPPWCSGSGVLPVMAERACKQSQDNVKGEHPYGKSRMAVSSAWNGVIGLLDEA